METVTGPPADAKEDTAAHDHLEELEDGEVDEVLEGEVEDLHRGVIEGSSDRITTGVPHDDNRNQVPHQTLPSQQSSPPDMPAIVTGGMDNEALKNLMMSWYYAGYYTGFYEGQNSATDTAAA